GGLRVVTAGGGFCRLCTMRSWKCERPWGCTSLGVHNANEIERGITQFAVVANGGLIVAPHPVTRGKLIIDLAAPHRLPAIYAFRFHTKDGGLVSYGIDQVGQRRSAATYVDRIRRGTNPKDLRVHQPSKYELVMNLKTAKALGRELPPTLLARADERIEWILASRAFRCLRWMGTAMM